MGIDFDINVNLHTTGKDQVDALEKQIEKLKNSSIKLNVDLSGDGADIAKYFTNIQKQAQIAGKGIGTSLQQGIKSVKFNGNSETFIKQYLEQIKKDTKEAESVAEKFDVSQKDALKAVNARNSAEIKANSEAIKEQKRQQKEIEAIESSRIKSIENAKKREEKATLAQNKAINKSLEESYKKQQQEQQKLNAQNLAQIRTAEESQKRIQVQQKISEMKASASQKNEHNNNLVQQGKDNIAKWKVQYQQQQKEIEAIENARIKASENAKKREEKLIQNQNNAINKSLENDYKQQQKNIEQRQQLISKQTELLDKNKKTLSSSLSNNTYANAKDIKEAKDLLQLINTTDLNKYNKPAKRVQEITSQVSKVTSKLSETHKLNLDNLNKEIAAEEKANIQNLKYIQQGEESQKRIQVQQQIAAMKANAVQKNAHYNSLVQQGKDNIIKWEQQYKEQNNYAEKLEATQKRIATLQTNSKADSFKGMYGDTAKYKDIENNLSKIEQLQSRINSEMAKGSSKDTSKINADLKEMTSLLSKSENAFNNLTKPISVLDASIASNKTLSWLKENSKATKELGSAFEELAERQKHATTAGELENYNKQYMDLVSTAQSKGLTGKSAFEEFGRAFKQIGQFAWTYGLIQQIPDAISKSVTELKEINTIVTEISKAADVPVKQLKDLETSSFSVASKYGQKASDYLLGVQEMTRAGYSDTSGMAELSTLAQSAGDMTAELANQYLIASDMAFGYGGNVEKLNALLDSQNQINKIVC